MSNSTDLVGSRVINCDLFDLSLAKAAAFEDERCGVAQPSERHLSVIGRHDDGSGAAAPTLLLATDR